MQSRSGAARKMQHRARPRSPTRAALWGADINKQNRALHWPLLEHGEKYGPDREGGRRNACAGALITGDQNPQSALQPCNSATSCHSFAVFPQCSGKGDTLAGVTLVGGISFFRLVPNFSALQGGQGSPLVLGHGVGGGCNGEGVCAHVWLTTPISSQPPTLTLGSLCRREGASN